MRGSPVRAYGLAVASVLVGLVLRWPLHPVLGYQLPFLLFFPAVMLTAWYGGLRPGLVATALSGAFSVSFLLPALFTPGGARITDSFGLGVFLLVGAGFSVLSERAHAATERLRFAYESEQALQERLSVTLRSIGDAVIATDGAGLVTFLNPVAEALTGWELAAARGKPLADVFVIVNEDTRDPVDSPVQKVIREGRTVGLANHTILISRTGVETSIADSASPIRDANGKLIGVVLVFRDAGPERAIEHALEESAARFKQLADAMPQMVWTARPDGFIDYYNARWCQFADCDPGETGDASRRAIIHPDDLVTWLERWARSTQVGEPYEIEYRFKDKRTGGYRWFLGRALPVRDGFGKIVKWFGTCTDIDAQKRNESALKDADRRKDQFLAMLGHELRNPLAPIRNAIELLKKEGLAEPRLQRARDILDRQTEQLTRLTDDLLEVSRITSGKIRLEEQLIDAASVVALAVETSNPLIEAGRHTLDVRLPSKPVLVRADARRLAQVLGNILNNAAKYTQVGGRITVTLERDGTDAVFRVKDDGPGIPAAMLDRVFDLFAQVDRSLARSKGGLGLGLTLVRALVEMHGGTVRAFSDGTGKGSEFVVRIPALPESIDPPDLTAPPVRGDRGDVPIVRILVVDDNADAANTLRELLELSGHDVRVAYEGQSALTLAEEFRPRLVLLDIGLPGMDGYEVALRLRGRHGQAMVLVALTGYGQEEDRLRTKEAGFDRHLVKPLEPRILSEVLAGIGAAAAQSE